MIRKTPAVSRSSRGIVKTIPIETAAWWCTGSRPDGIKADPVRMLLHLAGFSDQKNGPGRMAGRIEAGL